jgi:aminoglycoside 6'-N-acetyltransferase I
VLIRTVQQADAAAWERMRQMLWPSAPGEHAGEIERFFSGALREPAEVLLAIDDRGQAIGFAELSIRQYAEGCYSGRVGYLEGWFVEAEWRDKGIGARLVTSAEAWARNQGCTELASDTEIENTAGVAAHQSVGFTETNRIVCFRKDL